MQIDRTENEELDPRGFQFSSAVADAERRFLLKK